MEPRPGRHFEVGALDGSELPEAVSLLADAFADGPLVRCVTGRRSRRARRRSTARGLAIQLPLAVRHGRVLAVREGNALAGALVGAPPWAHPFPAPPLRARLGLALAQGIRVTARWAQVFEALQLRRPERAHWYLSLLGVAPAAQGRGIGSALLAAWLAEVDAAGGEVWLETDEVRSLGLYRAAGFAVRAELSLRDVPVWLLGRGARHA